VAGSVSVGFSQASHVSGGKIAGIRSWTGSTRVLAGVVMMAQVNSFSVGPGQTSQMPARAISSPPFSR
jgi:hypothetical protein